MEERKLARAKRFGLPEAKALEDDVKKRKRAERFGVVPTENKAQVDDRVTKLHDDAKKMQRTERFKDPVRATSFFWQTFFRPRPRTKPNSKPGQIASRTQTSPPTRRSSRPAPNASRPRRLKAMSSSSFLKKLKNKEVTTRIIMTSTCLRQEELSLSSNRPSSRRLSHDLLPCGFWKKDK